MNSFFYKITAWVMSVVLLASTFSLTVNMHYCGDTLVEKVVWAKAAGCGMEMNQPTTDGCSIDKPNCCDNTQETIAGQDELPQQSDQLSWNKQVFVATLVYTYSQLFAEPTKKVVSFRTYKPPLVVKPIYKLDETYLI
ncbi:hypothetical protein ACFSQ0_00265 [Mesonia sediminis]|uniref:Secreted protein n=1 Tax=Mesonia sediminis TaxID=1703946 RepID=A0ABW5SBB3_9FLAO